MITKILVNIASGNGLLPDGNKPLPDWQIISVKGSFTGNPLDIIPGYDFEKGLIKN